MALTNVSKPNTSLTNTTKINIGETWASNPYTWALETRTWADLQSLIDNTTKVFGGQLWATSTLPWQLPTPWIDAGSITNQAKP